MIPARAYIFIRTLVVAASLAAAGCATVGPPAQPLPAPPAAPSAPPAAPEPPPINLQGFPPSYRLGFGDGCSTSRGTEKRDPARFSADGNYRVGWQDGLAQCRPK